MKLNKNFSIIKEIIRKNEYFAELTNICNNWSFIIRNPEIRKNLTPLSLTKCHKGHKITIGINKFIIVPQKTYIPLIQKWINLFLCTDFIQEITFLPVNK